MNNDFNKTDMLFNEDPAELTHLYCKQQMEEIVREWGRSSKTLNKWLKMFRPEYMNNKIYSKNDQINADIFLPYRKNKLWVGKDALYRLRLAVGAEAVVIFNNKDLDVSFEEKKIIYFDQCLRLFTRINSFSVEELTYEAFVNLLNECYKEVSSDWDGALKYFQEKQNDFKKKRKQTLYHFTKDDFEIISQEMTLREAYKIWIDTTFPRLLDKYKEKLEQEFKIKAFNRGWSQEYKNDQYYNNFLKDFKLIKIKKPSIMSFRKLLEKHNIKYKQKRQSSSF